jgi:acyl-coenzyme A thioesterase PaaI-like protein
MTSSPPAGMEGHISVDRFNAILNETTPLAAYLGVRAERIENGEAWSRIAFSVGALRPGGTYSGPALMALVDMCMYAAVLGATGEDLRPVTTNFAITFVRRPPTRDLIARCTLLSRNSQLIVGSIIVYAEGDEAEVVCTSTCTYALPPRANEET